MDSINDRIAQLIKHLGMNNNSFSKAIGLSNNVTIGNIVGGRKSKPGYEILKAIALSFDSINSDWLLTGRGAILKKDYPDLSMIAESKVEFMKKCISCEEKEKMIRTQEKLIKSQEILIDQLTSNRQQPVSSKRKAG